MRRLALLAATVLLALPATASARSYSVPANVPETESGFSADSVALADGRVVWMEHRGDGAALVAAAEDGIPHDVYALPPARGAASFLGVFADGGTAIARRLVCVRVDCERDAADDTVRVELATGAGSELGLRLGTSCIGGLSLRGSVLSAHRCGRGSTVLDLADGTRRDLNGYVLAAAGPYAVVREEAPIGQKLTAIDWRTGAALGPTQDVSLDPRTSEAAIDTDGTLAWIEQGVKVLAPGAATPTTTALPPEGNFIAQVALANGRLAVRRMSEFQDNTLQFGEREVEGQHGNFGWAFDGTRIAWVAQPCAQTVIQVWDTTTDPPPPANDHCNVARLAQSTARLKGSRLTLRLRCPAKPERGCAGDVKADFPGGASTGWYGYRVGAGTTRTQVLLLRNRARRHSNLGKVTLENAYRTRRASARIRIQSIQSSDVSP